MSAYPLNAHLTDGILLESSCPRVHCNLGVKGWTVNLAYSSFEPKIFDESRAQTACWLLPVTCCVSQSTRRFGDCAVDAACAVAVLRKLKGPWHHRLEHMGVRGIPKLILVLCLINGLHAGYLLYTTRLMDTALLVHHLLLCAS